MLKIHVQVTGFFREVIGKSKFIVDIDADKKVSVFRILDKLCEEYGQPLMDLLYLEDGTLDNIIRVMINGRDIRFLSEDKLTLTEEDNLLIMSLSAGG